MKVTVSCIYCTVVDAMTDLEANEFNHWWLARLYYMVMGDHFGLSKKLSDLIQLAHILV